MKVSEIMSGRVVTVTPGTPYKHALEQMIDHGIGGLPVVDDDSRLVGIVTESDLVTKPAFGGPPRRRLEVLADILHGAYGSSITKARALTVADVMTTPVASIGADDDVREVARMMVEHGITRLPVTDREGTVIGIVSRRDVLKTFNRPDEVIRAEILARYAQASWAPEDAEVDVEVHDGVVRVRGSVHHPMDRPVMVGVAWSVPGVIGVEEHLEAREPDPTIVPS